MLRTLREGDSQTYHLDAQSQQTVELPNGMGDQDVSFKSSQDLITTIGKVDEGGQSAEIELKTTHLKFDADSAAGNPFDQSSLPKEIVLRGKIDNHNRISGLKGDDATNATLGGDFGSSATSLMSVELPARPVAIGDSWNTMFPKTPFTPGGPLKTTLTGERSVDGRQFWVIHLQGSLPLDMDTSKMEVPNQDSMEASGLLVKGTVDLDSEILVDESDDLLHSAETRAKVAGSIQVASLGTGIQFRGTGGSQMKRVE